MRESQIQAVTAKWWSQSSKEDLIKAALDRGLPALVVKEWGHALAIEHHHGDLRQHMLSWSREDNRQAMLQGCTSAGKVLKIYAGCWLNMFKAAAPTFSSSTGLETPTVPAQVTKPVTLPKCCTAAATASATSDSTLPP